MILVTLEFKRALHGFMESVRSVWLFLFPYHLQVNLAGADFLRTLKSPTKTPEPCAK